MQTKKAKRPWRIGTRAKVLLRGLRYARILPYASVDGWLTVDEAIALHELARALPDERALAVEIGSWQGKSSICLASGLRSKRRARLVCIDPFDASGDKESRDEYAARQSRVDGPLRSAFEANLADAGVRDLVEVQAGFSHHFAATFREPIDLLFLDGDHSFDGVARDFRDWAPKVRAGGYLAMHDVVHAVHEGPRRVVEEMIKADPHWVDHRYVDSLFVARRAMR